MSKIVYILLWIVVGFFKKYYYMMKFLLYVILGNMYMYGIIMFYFEVEVLRVKNFWGNIVLNFFVSMYDVYVFY